TFLGLILTKVGSIQHGILLEKTLAPILQNLNLPLLGLLYSSDSPSLASRHLGLKQVAENKDFISEDYLSNWFKRSIDTETFLKRLGLTLPLKKRATPPLKPFFAAKDKPRIKKTRPILAIAYDQAFNFCYADLPAYLTELGLEIVFFSPLKEQKIPSCQGIYLTGGYPELFVEILAQNEALKAELQEAKEVGKVIYAECGGFMYLFETLTLLDGRTFPLAALFKGQVKMQARKKALGYREATLVHDFIPHTSPLVVRGHEFHYSSVETSFITNPLWQFKNREGQDLGVAGLAQGLVSGSYLHLTTYGASSFWQGLVKLLEEV
ncbi:MAG: hypothetical protein IJU40_06040, partial [Desulfovibrionaceae bacterium]|nr:hypothetical protein [Desulfovibrionaceae bacterium]